MEVWYTARQKFDCSLGEPWAKYIAWSGLVRLKRVLSLDIILCPPVRYEVLPEDWAHNVQADFLLSYFRDLNYLRARVPDQTPHNILAVVLEPDADAVTLFGQGEFVLSGFDLVERTTGVSALVNCGGFDLAFESSDLSEDGLIGSYRRARDVQLALRQHYPNDHHADCDLWAISFLDHET